MHLKHAGKISSSAESFWLILSILVAPIDEQVSFFTDLPESEPFYGFDTALLGFQHALQDDACSWNELFFESPPRLGELMSDYVASSDFWPWSKKGFIEDFTWNGLRNFAKVIFKVTEVQPLSPISDFSYIKFSEYPEFIDIESFDEDVKKLWRNPYYPEYIEHIFKD